jgi:threonine aldolase
VDLAASKRSAAEWSADLERKGVRVSPASATTLRFVTQRHVGNAEVDAAVNAFASLW